MEKKSMGIMDANNLMIKSASIFLVER